MKILAIILISSLALFLLILIGVGIWCQIEIAICNRNLKKLDQVSEWQTQSCNLIYKWSVIQIYTQDKFPAPNGDKNFNWYHFFLKRMKGDEWKKWKSIEDVWNSSEDYKWVVSFCNENNDKWEEAKKCYKLSVGY